jgi:hypothetical protein
VTINGMARMARMRFIKYPQFDNAMILD